MLFGSRVRNKAGESDVGVSGFHGFIDPLLDDIEKVVKVIDDIEGQSPRSDELKSVFAIR